MAEIQTLPEMHHIRNKDFDPNQKHEKRYTIHIKKTAIFISSYKSQQSTGNLNDYRLNAIATMANLHWPYKEHLTLKNVTTRYQQQIFQATCKAILLLCLILHM
jgi:hypothetical protein